MMGLFLFAVHWLIWTVEYILEFNYFNSVFSAMAVIFLLYMAFHEFRDYTWKENTESLKWLSGVVFLAGFSYYLISYNPYAAAAVIYPVAWLTVSLMNGLNLLPTGEKLFLSEINYSDPSQVYVPIPPANVNIILACTAIQAIIIFAAVILFTSSPIRLRLKVFAVNFGLIYSLNIVRNVSTIWLVGTGTLSFPQAHEGLGKIFSLIVLMLLAYWTFMKLPEILDNFFGLMDLRFRNKPGMIVDGFVVLPEDSEEKPVKSTSKKSKNIPQSGSKQLKAEPKDSQKIIKLKQ